MPIDQEFLKNYHVTTKYKHGDGEHYHFVWQPGKSNVETSIILEKIQQKFNFTKYNIEYLFRGDTYSFN